MRKRFRKVERACARLEGSGRATRFALMLRDASQRGSAVDASALASCCDAPQHEGERGRRYVGQRDPLVILAKRSHVAVRKEEPTCGCGKRSRLRSIVSGLLFTMNCATPTCRASALARVRTTIRLHRVRVRIC